MWRLLLSLSWLLVFSSEAGASSDSTHAREATRIIGELRAIGLPERSQEIGPLADVPRLLRKLNHELRELIVDDLNDSSRPGVPGEQEIMDQLRAAGWDDIPDHKWNSYGEIVAIPFDWKLGYEPGLLVVSTQLWIPCGSDDPDAAVYVFRGRGRNWRLVLATDADFDSIDLEATGMQYRLSPPDDRGNWYLVLAHAPPVCRFSGRQYLRYKVLRPGKSPDEPVIVLRSREPINPEFSPPFRIRAETDWFAITRGKQRKLDGEPGVSIARYEILGSQARRIQPLALTVQDFLDEWTQLSWDEAVRWTGDANRQRLHEWHEKLSAFVFESTEMQHSYSCSKPNSDDTVLIDLWIDRKLNRSVVEEHVYSLITSRNGAYFLEAIETGLPSECHSEVAGDALSREAKQRQLPEW